jgi:hypothetical protein
MADNDFGPVLGVNDDDEAMGGVYNAAAAEVDDYMFRSLNGDDGDEIDGVGNEAMLAPLKSIFHHPLITKVHVEDNGRQVPAWRCGFCAPDAQGMLNNIFKGAPNAKKALKHVTRTPGQVRPCNGNIPPATMQQFQRLFIERAAVKDQRATNRQIVSTSIDDAQERVFQSMANTGRRQQVLMLV